MSTLKPTAPRVVAGAERQSNLLANAAREARARKLDEITIIDVDCHILETIRFRELAPYIDVPRVKRIFERYQPSTTLLPKGIGDREVGGRIFREEPHVYTYGHASVELFLEELDLLSIDYACIFPTPMLSLGVHPDVELEVAVARAYNRWVIDTWLAASDRLKAMLYLPFNDAEASYREVEDLGDKRGVIGFMVTSVRDSPVYDNRYMRTYAALEERGLPIGFHPAVQWREGFRQLNKFLTVHALGFPTSNMIQMANVVINGLPERFPDLKWVFLESGIFWVPFVMARLDNEFMMRPSEAPLLQRKPSEYIRDFYIAAQPLEMPERMEHLEAVFDMIDAEHQLLYSSDWPHWDFDLPSQIYDLPFLSEAAKRNILGGNAMRLFGLPERARGTA